ncbi:MAG: hypothetical protein AYK18_15155 [Theionarchaea archaeon DG-70]|nr:MAG: hypothetical protein AYK18_15155 [Theionarchaea archaeon DG-70]
MGQNVSLMVLITALTLCLHTEFKIKVENMSPRIFSLSSQVNAKLYRVQYGENLFKHWTPKKTMGLKECVNCGKKFNDSFSYCPHCGRKKGASSEEMKSKSMEDIRKAIEKNIKAYRKQMESTSEILEIVKQKDRNTFEMQKKLTEKILNRFPEIERRIREDHNVRFQAFIINVPYEWKKGPLHNCMLQELAKKNDDIANFCLGVQELAIDLYEVNIPIWTNEPFGEGALKKQLPVFKKAIPWEQMKFMYVAEPWHFINRVHDFDGRWINWRVIFKISEKEFKEFTEEYKEIPLSIQKFSDLKYANHFSTVGTALDGESFLGVIENSEIPQFMSEFRSLESSFPQTSKPTLELIKIDWDLLKEFGFFNFSLEKILSSEPHLFSRHVSRHIMDTAKEELARFTKQKVLREEQKRDEILDIIAEGLVTIASEEQRESISKIVKPIPRNLRNEYRIFGDAK